MQKIPQQQNIKPSRKLSSTGRYLRKYWALYAMMIIPLLYFIIFKYGPMFGNILAFRRYAPGGSPWGSRSVGFYYFKRFLRDPSFHRAFRNTLVLSVLNIVVNFPIPIVFAILLNEVRNKYFRRTVQTISYLPRFISTVVVIAILNELLSPSTGIVNLLLQNAFGLDPTIYMLEPEYFRPIYVLSNTWQFTGWTAIIYMAAISGISQELYEAADIDGAGHLQKVFYITIPSIMPTIMIMLILEVGRLLSLGFEKVLLMYSPRNSQVSDIIDTLVYRTGIASGGANYSYATAIGLFSGIIGLVLVSGSNFLSKKLTDESIY